MAIAYVSFCKPINYDTCTALIRVCRETLWQRDQQGNRLGPYDKMQMTISSTGGGLAAAFAAYNEIKLLPTEITTINAGAVDSSAWMIFMVGKFRRAAKSSAFLLHQPHWTFGAANDQPLVVVSDAQRWLMTYQQMMADIIASGTDGKLKAKDVAEMMRVGTTLSSEEALAHGLIHSIEEPTMGSDDRWWQV